MAAPCALIGGRRACRLVSPADGYQKAFRPALRRALLAWRCASVLLADPHASMEAVVPRVRRHAVKEMSCQRSAGDASLMSACAKGAFLLFWSAPAQKLW